jgi:hypothetical protein
VDTLVHLITQFDRFHLDAQPARKEWHHFCVLGQEVRVIFNASQSGGAARVILLTHDDRWDGDVDSIPSEHIQIHPETVDVRLGHNAIRFEDGMFWISAALQDRPIALKLALRPRVPPWLMRNSMTIPQGDMNWLVVPRLTATGTITLGKQVYTLKDAPAYHDHNWGHWQWGQDFSWQWGFALPDLAWSVVFCRTTNRARNRVLDLTLALWKGSRLQRLFTQREVEVSQSGYLRRKRVDKYPRVMALVSPEATTDVPRQLELVGASNGDQVRCRFHAEDVAQVVIPNETDLDSTIVNQVIGRFEMEGRVAGESVATQGSGIFEFLVA